jgi:hypothetical protein
MLKKKNNNQLQIKFEVKENLFSSNSNKVSCKIIPFKDKVIERKLDEKNRLISYVLNNTKSF